MATIALAAISATAFADKTNDSSAALSAGQAVSGAVLLIFILVALTFKSSKNTTVKTSSKSYY